MSEAYVKIDIFGAECTYLVSNFGNVYNTSRNEYCTKFIDTDKNVMKVTFQGPLDSYISIPVCNLVAHYFLPNPENKTMLVHKSADITNNAVTNLEWVNSSDLPTLNRIELTYLDSSGSEASTPETDIPTRRNSIPETMEYAILESGSFLNDSNFLNNSVHLLRTISPINGKSAILPET